MLQYIAYIIGHYKPLARIATQFLTLLMLCVLWQNLQFKLNSERRTFEKLFKAIFFSLSQFLPEISWQEGNPWNNISYFV